MKQRQLDTAYLSAFCMELYLTTKAGISYSEGVRLLQEDKNDSETGQILETLYQQLEIGEPFAVAMRAAGGFPVYVTEMIEIGERTGHLESVFHALAEYYEKLDRLNKNIRQAIMYPSVLLTMMLFVILILLIRVLPIFHSVFQQLGVEMSPLAISLMQFGETLGKYGLSLLGVLVAVIIAGVLYLRNPIRKQQAEAVLLKWMEQKKLGRALAASRIADAMEMALSSGLDTEQALDMALKLVPGEYTRERVETCKRLMLLEDLSFAEAAGKTGLFKPVHCRMIGAGFRAGSADYAMKEVAKRCGDELEDTLDSMLGKIEPTLVIVLSLAVGIILLSVMLPLMGIMTAIG